VNLRADALEVLESWRPGADDQDRLRQRFIGHLRSHPDGMLRSCRSAHVTASTLVTTKFADEVMLVLHGKAGRWFQFGGHCEETDGSLVEAAVRELREESGLDGVVIDPEPVHLDAHPVPFCGPEGSIHLDVRFVAVADRTEDGGGSHVVEPTVPESAAAVDLVAWWPIDGLPSDEESLLALIRAARQRLGHDA
jgi:8-oxo-dGTP pyrophosphatase MutT (NUDIX family)